MRGWAAEKIAIVLMNSNLEQTGVLTCMVSGSAHSADGVSAVLPALENNSYATVDIPALLSNARARQASSGTDIGQGTPSS